MYLSLGAKKNDQYVFTIDHHLGSEEHQINEEYFDDETYDHNNKRVNTLPLLIENINQCKAKNIVPIVADSKEISSNWTSNIGMLFIDGGHSYESADSYECPPSMNSIPIFDVQLEDISLESATIGTIFFALH